MTGGPAKWLLAALGLVLLASAGCPPRGNPKVQEVRAQATRQPSNPAAWNQLGDACFGQGMYNDAYIAYKHAGDLDPGNFDAHLGMAQVSLQLNDPQSGLREVEKAMAKDPLNTKAIAIRGRLRLASGEVEQAVTDLAQAVKDEARVESKDARVETRLALVSAYRILKRQDEALSLANSTTYVFPQEGRAHYIYATMLELAQRYEEAEKEYRLAINYDPKLLRAKFRLADMLVSRSSDPAVLKEARELALQVDGEDAGDGTARGLAAWALYKTGEKQNAVLELSRVYQDFPDNLRVLVWINQGAKELKDDKLAAASAQAIRKILVEQRIGAGE